MNKEEIYNINTEIYKKIYNNLIQTRLYRGTKRVTGDGYNKHHIIPKCMGGTDNDNNFVLLTFKEHLLAHRLLTRIYPDNNALRYAFLRMIQSSHSDRKENTYKIDENGNKVPYTLNSKELEELRLTSVIYLRDINLGTKASEETKEKLSNIHLGMKYSERTKKHLSDIRLGKHIKSQILVISPDGITYSSIAQAMIDKNVSRSFIMNPINKFQVIRQVESIRNKKVMDPSGKIYKNVSNCAKELGLNKTTIIRWIKEKPYKGFKFID